MDPLGEWGVVPRHTGVIILRTQTTHYLRETPQNYHTFALFDSPRMGNLMIPDIPKETSAPFIAARGAVLVALRTSTNDDDSTWRIPTANRGGRALQPLTVGDPWQELGKKMTGLC